MKRYSLKDIPGFRAHPSMMEQSKNGNWVRYEDVEALIKKREILHQSITHALKQLAFIRAHPDGVILLVRDALQKALDGV